MKKFKFVSVLSSIVLFPLITFAGVIDSNSGGSSGCTVISNSSKFQDAITYVICIINSYLIPLVFAIAFIVFVWGVVNFFILNGDEEAKRSQGKQFMIWGIIALAVMVGVWGLVGIVGNTFGIKSVIPQTTPPTQ